MSSDAIESTTSGRDDYLNTKNSLETVQQLLDQIIPLLSSNEDLRPLCDDVKNAAKRINFRSLLNLHRPDHSSFDEVLQIVHGILSTKPAYSPTFQLESYERIMNIYKNVLEVKAILTLRNGDYTIRTINLNCYFLSAVSEGNFELFRFSNYAPVTGIPTASSCIDRISTVKEHLYGELINGRDCECDTPLMTVLTNPSERMLRQHLEKFAAKYRYESVSEPRLFEITLEFVMLILETLSKGIEGSSEPIIEMLLEIFKSLSIYDFICSMENFELKLYLSRIIYFLKKVKNRMGASELLFHFGNMVQSIHILQVRTWYPSLGPDVIRSVRRAVYNRGGNQNIPVVDQLKNDTEHLWVEKFTKFPTLDQAIAIHDSECAICFNNLIFAPDVAVLSACTHIICLSCTEQWFASRRRYVIGTLCLVHN